MVETRAYKAIRTKINKPLHKIFPFSCYASALVFLLLLLASPIKLATVKESSIKAKSTKDAAKFSTFVLFILILKRLKCFQNFPRLSRETSRGAHAFVLLHMLRQNSHLLTSCIWLIVLKRPPMVTSYDKYCGVSDSPTRRR